MSTKVPCSLLHTTASNIQQADVYVRQLGGGFRIHQGRRAVAEAVMVFINGRLEADYPYNVPPGNPTVPSKADWKIYTADDERRTNPLWAVNSYASAGCRSSHKILRQ